MVGLVYRTIILKGIDASIAICVSVSYTRSNYGRVQKGRVIQYDGFGAQNFINLIYSFLIIIFYKFVYFTKLS